MSRLRHLGWAQCSLGLTSRLLESCHHQCLQAVCGVLGYLRGAAMELFDGTLKLRHCTRLSSRNLPPWDLPRLGRSLVGKRFTATLGNLLDCSGNFGKRVRLTWKTLPSISILSHLDSGPVGHPTPRRWKRLHLPDSSGAGGEVGGASQSFSSTFGWVRFVPGTPGTCPRREQAQLGAGWSVQPKGLAHGRQPFLIGCMIVGVHG